MPSVRRTARWSARVVSKGGQQGTVLVPFILPFWPPFSLPPTRWGSLSDYVSRSRRSGLQLRRPAHDGRRGRDPAIAHISEYMQSTQLIYIRSSADHSELTAYLLLGASET